MTKSRFIKSIVEFLARKNPTNLNINMGALSNQLAIWKAHAAPELKTNQQFFTEGSWGKVIAEMNRAGCPLLARVLNMVKNTPASEASSERGFFLVKRMVTPQRECLSGNSAATQVKYSSLLAAQEKDARELFPDAAFADKELVVVPKFERKCRKIDRVEPTVGEDGEVIIVTDEATLVARTIHAVLDMAVEKAAEVKKTRDARRAALSRKAKCEGPVASSGKCDKFNNTRTNNNYNLILCTICGKTRCNSCWGFAFGNTFTGEHFVCNGCKDDDIDDWFRQKMDTEKIDAAMSLIPDDDDSDESDDEY